MLQGNYSSPVAHVHYFSSKFCTLFGPIKDMIKKTAIKGNNIPGKAGVLPNLGAGTAEKYLITFVEIGTIACQSYVYSTQ